MTAYIANHQKKKKIFGKREQELKHALKHNYGYEKVARAVEKLREAKLNIFKSEFAKNSVLPASSYEPGDEALKWLSYSIDDIKNIYND